MIRAAETPGPNQYNTQHDYSKLNGGRFSTANPKSDLEWTMHTLNALDVGFTRERKGCQSEAYLNNIYYK
jgi:hypothetical protein